MKKGTITGHGTGRRLAQSGKVHTEYPKARRSRKRREPRIEYWDDDLLEDDEDMLMQTDSEEDSEDDAETYADGSEAVTVYAEEEAAKQVENLQAGEEAAEPELTRSEYVYERTEDGYDSEDSGYDYDPDYDGDEDMDSESDTYDEDAADYDDDYYDDDDRYDRQAHSHRSGKRRTSKLIRLSGAEIGAYLMGVLVLIAAVAFLVFFLKVNERQKQLAAFADIGQQLDGIDRIGGEGLDGVALGAENGFLLDENGELIIQDEFASDVASTEVSLMETGEIPVVLTTQSIKKDLKIKFQNGNTKKLIANVPFEVKVSGPVNETWTDDDKDGIIYKKDIKGGKYTVTVDPLPEELASQYDISAATQTVTVQETIAYKEVDVRDEIKKESEVNVAKEDTGKKNAAAAVESENKDTVEAVQSTKTADTPSTEAVKDEDFTKIDKLTIADPSTAAVTDLLLPSIYLPNFRQMTSAGNISGGSSGGTISNDNSSDNSGGNSWTDQTTDSSVVTNTDKSSDPSYDPFGDNSTSSDAANTATSKNSTSTTGNTASESASKASTADPFAENTNSGTSSSGQNSGTSTSQKTATDAGSASSTSPAADTSSSTDSAATAKSVDMTAPLKDKNGNPVYVKDGDKYREATAADYYSAKEFFIRATATAFKYTGWQTIDGKKYYFDKNGQFVTGAQVIQGVQYTFGSDGVLKSGSGILGIDVSKWNGSIDWKAVKSAGIEFAIIRCGYRGSASGVLIEDPMFRTNVQGAQAAGIKVGAYLFTQAISDVEAVEEASMAIELCKGMGLSYPIYLDVEKSGGRADALDRASRTAVIKAFCATVANAGFQTGVYASSSWLTDQMNIGELSGYKVWLAQYKSAPTYTGHYNIWQYSYKGTVPGISGKVDMNIGY